MMNGNIFELEIPDPASGMIVYQQVRMKDPEGIFSDRDTLHQVGYAILLYNDSVFLKEYIHVIMFIDSKNEGKLDISELKKKACNVVREKIKNNNRIYIDIRFIENLLDWDHKEMCE